MPFRDIAGVPRPGHFEEIEDPVVDATFAPLHGVGNRATYSVKGPGATGNPPIVESKFKYSPRISWDAMEQGAVRPPPIDVEAIVMSSPPKRGKLGRGR